MAYVSEKRQGYASSSGMGIGTNLGISTDIDVEIGRRSYEYTNKREM